MRQFAISFAQKVTIVGVNGDLTKSKEKRNTKIRLMPTAVENELFPIFQDPSSEGLLSKCLHGHTQNVYEALNHII